MSWRSWLIVGLIGVVPLVYAVLWGWLLSLSNPLTHPLADLPLWPIACTTRGCISSTHWMTNHQLQSQFATATGQPAPRIDQSFTTVVRELLLQQSHIRSPIRLEDARRYRNDILHLPDAEIETLVGAPAAQYDEAVLMPFLVQEYLREQYRAESPAELYQLLSEQRFLLLLPIQFRWDSNEGAVHLRD